MKSFQFMVCVILDDGFVMPIERLISPVIVASSFKEAINHPDIEEFCTTNKCRIFRAVG